MLDKFYTKEGLAIENIINDVISMSEEDKIKSISEYAKEFNFARGTIQNAFRFLNENNALIVETKGRLGSYVKKIDKIKLIQLSGKQKIIGVMPLPYSIIYQGLATAIFLETQSDYFDLQMAYMRGADSRIAMLLEDKFDFVIMSKLSAEHYIEKNENIEIICGFGKETYVNKHMMVLNSESYRKNNIKKFGIDASSQDIAIITEHQCMGKEIELIKLPYMQLYNNVSSGYIDGAIINVDNIDKNNPNLIFKMIDEDYFKGKDTEATLIIRKNNAIVKEILEENISIDNIKKIQNKVFTGEQHPIY